MYIQSKIGQGHPSSNTLPQKIGQVHLSSNLTKTLPRYLHGISLGPMQLIFVELSCLQAKIAHIFMLNRPP